MGTSGPRGETRVDRLEAQQSGVLERQDFCWDKKREEESTQPQTYPQGS